MNTGQLIETIDLLLGAEEQSNFQAALDGLINSLGQLVQQPQNAGFQKAVSQAMATLAKAGESLGEIFNAAQKIRIVEIGGKRFFIDSLEAEIEEVITRNGIAPAAARDHTSKLAVERRQYLNILQELKERLNSIGIIPTGPAPGEAEVGFTLPREIFQNQLDGLLRELRHIRLALRIFSESATGSYEAATVKQISTSAPLLFFGLHPKTIAMIALTVEWTLSKWKKIEEIRKLRAETAKINSEVLEDISERFENAIKKFVNDAISERADELATGKPEDFKLSVTNVLTWLFASIERGMTIEVRYMPPPAGSADQEPDAAKEKKQAFDTIKKTVPELVFPPPSSDPVLRLEEPQKRDNEY